ncbi:CAP domain-containing protein [Dactylosporangium sp. NPDC049140]|uniref:CAP domain-containing protein n=1 Tax=Dactylosporangium sp. NPDC049140 TaxID=3155647 RepID=UPI0033CDB124
MVSRNFFDHTGSGGSNFVQREVAAGCTAGASAENIAWGYRTAQDVVTGWINSPGRRADILNCTSVAVGVGLAYKADGTRTGRRTSAECEQRVESMSDPHSS